MPIPIIAQVQRDALPDRVFDALRDGVLDGVCAPGERLHVASIADAYETSRPTVMTALERLVATGLVERGYRAFQVVRPSVEEGSSAAAALQWLARALGEANTADAAIAAVRELDAAGGRAPLDAVLTRFNELCDAATNTVFAGVVRAHLVALAYMAQFRLPAEASAA